MDRVAGGGLWHNKRSVGLALARSERIDRHIRDDCLADKAKGGLSTQLFSIAVFQSRSVSGFGQSRRRQPVRPPQPRVQERLQDPLLIAVCPALISSFQIA